MTTSRPPSTAPPAAVRHSLVHLAPGTQAVECGRPCSCKVKTYLVPRHAGTLWREAGGLHLFSPNAVAPEADYLGATVAFPGWTQLEPLAGGAWTWRQPALLAIRRGTWGAVYAQ